jgi:hypothetical protein
VTGPTASSGALKAPNMLFAVGAVICGTLLRCGPLNAKDTLAPQVAGASSAVTEAGRSVSA